ncbi:MAG: hypothetical protein WBI07_05155 [Mobilitalea sp.]
MKMILTATILLIFLLGLYIMKKTDKFHIAPLSLRENGDPPSYQEQNVLIMGCSIIADKLKQLLIKNKIEYDQIEESNQFNQLNKYQYLFAVSDNDFENLMIGNLINKSRNMCKKIAICNCIDNLTIFEQNNIPCLFGTDISEDALFHAVFSERQIK